MIETTINLASQSEERHAANVSIVKQRQFVIQAMVLGCYWAFANCLSWFHLRSVDTPAGYLALFIATDLMTFLAHCIIIAGISKPIRLNNRQQKLPSISYISPGLWYRAKYSAKAESHRTLSNLQRPGTVKINASRKTTLVI